MNLKLMRMEIRYERDVVLARQRARAVAAALKFDVQAQTRLATAVSEIARNAFQYTGGGWIDFEINEDVSRMLMVSVHDRGPGIPNLDEILAGKYVSQTGMGMSNQPNQGFNSLQSNLSPENVIRQHMRASETVMVEQAQSKGSLHIGPNGRLDLPWQANSGSVDTIQMCPKNRHLRAKFMQQSISFHQSSFSLPAASTCELDAVSSLLAWRSGAS